MSLRLSPVPMPTLYHVAGGLAPIRASAAANIFAVRLDTGERVGFAVRQSLPSHFSICATVGMAGVCTWTIGTRLA